MANKTLFNTRAPKITKATSRNKAGGKAYALTDAEALCQYAVTSTFSDAYYVSGKEQLDEVKRLSATLPAKLVAKIAVYGHEHGRMKDAPAYLLAALCARRETELVKKVFPRVITSPKMLLNFVQIVRSGVTGRKSFGSAVKNLINGWITSRYGNKLFRASIGKSNPSFADLIKMTHPRPQNDEQDALFAYLLGKPHEAECLPPLVKEFEAFKQDNSNPMPDLDYRALTNCGLTEDHWRQVSRNMPWNALRMNLNVLNRNGVFNDDASLERVCDKLRNEEDIKRWNAFPYQLLTTFQNVDVPMDVKLALQDALEIATNNVPVLGKRVAVCCDVSGSMTFTKATGHGVTTCADVAALIASSVARTNPGTWVIPFGTRARHMSEFNPRDSLATNTERLARQGDVCGHGTNAADALRVIVESKKKFDFVIYVGDSQSWVDSRARMSGSGTMHAWDRYQQVSKNKKAKLVEVVLGPYVNNLMPTGHKQVMNIGGFSDVVFDIMAEFAERDDNVKFLDVIESVQL